MRPPILALAAAVLLAALAAACGGDRRGGDAPPPPAATEATATPTPTIAPTPTPATPPTPTASPPPIAPSPAPATPPTPTTPPTAIATPNAAPAVEFGDGEYRIGIDIPPGRYRTTTAGDDCEWETDWSFASPDYPAPVVDLDLEAGAFRSRGCGTWSDALTPVATPGQPFGDGWLVVGVDIAPGRYRTAATTECVWERLEGFRGWYRVSDRRSFELPRRPDGNGVLLSGTPSDSDLPIGTSEYAGQPEPRWESFLAVVDIDGRDAGFRSEGCGVWSSDLAPRASPGQPFGEGTFLVGPEVAPGRYRAESPTALCRWQRWKRFGGWPYSQYLYGDFDELVGGLAGVLWHDVPPGQAIVDIAPSDAGFHSEGCGVWTNDLSPPPAPARSFGDGTLRVGVDIAPGRYRSLSPHECEWARLSAFGGSFGDVIAVGAVAIVDIAPSDAGFHGAGCGSWTNDLSPASAPGQPFGGGALVVGREIAPGRYYAHPDPEASEARQCRWQRLREGGSGLERARRRLRLANPRRSRCRDDGRGVPQRELRRLERRSGAVGRTGPAVRRRRPDRDLAGRPRSRSRTVPGVSRRRLRVEPPARVQRDRRRRDRERRSPAGVLDRSVLPSGNGGAVRSRHGHHGRDRADGRGLPYQQLRRMDARAVGGDGGARGFDAGYAPRAGCGPDGDRLP